MKKKLILWVTQTKTYNWFLMKVIPYVRFSTYYTNIRGRKYLAGYHLLKPGDIIVAKDDNKLTTKMIGGDFTHAAFCIDKLNQLEVFDPKLYEVAEMTHTNYTESFFFDICKEADRVVILRCKDFDAAYIKSVIEMCKSFSDRPYDGGFELGVKALYCSELVYQSDHEHRLQVSLEDVAGIGQPYISPTGLYKAKNVEVIYDSNTINN